MPIPAPDFDQIFTDGSRHSIPGLGDATVQLRQETSLWMPSGKVYAGEPFMFGSSDDGAFVQEVPPGTYPVVLAEARFGEPDQFSWYQAVAAIKIQVRDEPATSWEMALVGDQDASTLDGDSYFGYPVDGGTGGFIDAANLSFCDDEEYVDRVLEALEERDYTGAGRLADEQDRTVVVVCSSGGGDGHYPTWVGRNAGGEITCFVTDFFILTDDGDDEDDDEGDGGPLDAPDYAPGDYATGHEMRTGQTLRRESLTSENGRFSLVHQDDGNIVLYENESMRAWWASNTCGADTALCALRETDGLVLFAPSGRRIWSTGAVRPAATLVVRDDGNVTITDVDGEIAWTSDSTAAVPGGPAAIGDRMLPGQTLGRQSLTSPSGRHTLTHQDDGNLVLYSNEGRGALWASNTQFHGTGRCKLLDDGDLVLYDKRGGAVWSTGTAGNPGAQLTVGDDGLELRNADDVVVWSVRTTPGTQLTDGHSPLSAATSAIAPTAMTMAEPLQPVVAAELTAATPAIPMGQSVPAQECVPAEPSES
ncbi:DUF4241 domain-containing protein [Saccharopolyspora endophytica]|uniref:DUF4241 domain-containing protein n=1 Tax=Saccharopolyspora endophytica TaxID=543886 RepID=A0ABS5DNF1_9PSEU|nr:DUF4241 domain-containing protein [Saccharopolyspora endophytica]MBQ0927826.1 DUF4241 domain-containing protein [Saccharopolyspora endophytica]